MNFNFKIVQNKKIFFIISAVVIILGIISMIFRPFYLDVDFAGGTEITYSIKTEGFNAATESTVINGLAREALSAIGSDSDLINNAIASDDEVIIRSKELNEYEIDAIDATLKEYYGDPVAPLRTIDEINKELAAIADAKDAENAEDEAVNDEAEAEANAEETVVETTETTTETEEEKAEVEEIVSRVGMDSVGASVSKDLRDAAVLSTTIAVILMLLYITIRFQFSSAIAAVICLCHDVFIVLAAYSILQIPVSSSIIAVILTILGYSINATIIIFDRVRENVKRNQSNTFAENVNISVNQSLTRSINTTITTLLTIGLIYILGVQSIKEFALPLIIGIVAGLYSSVFLSGSLWASLKKKGNRVR